VALVGHWRVLDAQSAHETPAQTWFDENDPEGVAFEYEVLE
jgi:hypothetical protein